VSCSLARPGAPIHPRRQRATLKVQTALRPSCPGRPAAPCAEGASKSRKRLPALRRGASGACLTRARRWSCAPLAL